MKKNHYCFLALLVAFVVTSLTIKPQESKRLFEKTIFVEVNLNDDSLLFQPYSKAWGERWFASTSININGTPLMDYDKYKSAFANRTDNLWTTLHPMIIDGTVKSYYPYDPESYGLGNWDEGELRYPLVGEDESETFLTSETVRENLCVLLGRFGPQYDVPLVDEYGDNIIITEPDGAQSFKYQAPDFYWCSDKDITKYKLRVSLLLNKKGKEKKRVIKSISPVVNRYSETGEIIGEEELIWFDFEELEPILKKTYFFDENWKSVSYSKYLRQKVDNVVANPSE